MMGARGWGRGSHHLMGTESQFGEVKTVLQMVVVAQQGDCT